MFISTKVVDFQILSFIQKMKKVREKVLQNFFFCFFFFDRLM